MLLSSNGTRKQLLGQIAAMRVVLHRLTNYETEYFSHKIHYSEIARYNIELFTLMWVTNTKFNIKVQIDISGTNNRIFSPLNTQWHMTIIFKSLVDGFYDINMLKIHCYLNVTRWDDIKKIHTE